MRDAEDGLAFAQEALRASGAAHAARARLSDVVLRRLKGLPAAGDEEGPEFGTSSLGGLAADADDDDRAVLGDDGAQ